MLQALEARPSAKEEDETGQADCSTIVRDCQAEASKQYELLEKKSKALSSADTGTPAFLAPDFEEIR